MDLFDARNIAPMLIKNEAEPFDDSDYIFELKLDGIRCIAYLGEDTDLRNKRNIKLAPIFPELERLHMQIKKPCVLDGELVVMEGGAPVFSQIQRRALMTNKTRIEMQAAILPASFVAYDILYFDGQQLTDRPLLERKATLSKAVKEGGQLAVSHYIQGKGIELFKLTTEQHLEGIVGKRKESFYYFGKHTSDWVKIKNMLDDDFVVTGYLKKGGRIALILGQYQGDLLVYKGHVMGLSHEVKQVVSELGGGYCPFDPPPKDHQKAVWLIGHLVCRVEFMEAAKGGGLRQPIFRGFRDDKVAKDCIDNFKAEE